MANYVMNEVKVTKGLEIFEQLMLDEEGNITFNKIIPRHEDLEITSPCEWNKKSFNKELASFCQAIETFLTENYNETLTQEEFVNKTYLNIPNHLKFSFIEAQGRDITSDDYKKYMTNLLKGFFNEKRYGYTSWYEWSYANWGTKWDALTEVQCSDGSSYCFQTAWSCPTPVFNKLASMGVEFILAWADEDKGHNLGIVEVKDGQVKDLLKEIVEKTGVSLYAMSTIINGNELEDEVEAYRHYDEEAYGSCEGCTGNCEDCEQDVAYSKFIEKTHLSEEANKAYELYTEIMSD